ncbi:GreA/GreB family elongation factor [Herminiimonas arsenitoxidans]|uniref:GreA/GreB family elongation factor n=1 Tax=Herminiimonas arsenitoxidans TaxID=1809410 RepID=UPI0009710778|nr:GreA/GreB family elongation factor [Herminiimonas arsenitoxidans]
MNKAFVKETGDDDALSLQPEMPLDVKNYITPEGYQRLQNELLELVEVTRAHVLQTEQDATNQTSLEFDPERTLREIDQRIHYLQTRLESAEIVDPSVHVDGDQVFFGASVTYQNAIGEQHTVTIVGLDELDPAHGKISWLAPLAQTLLGANEGDTVLLESPAGTEKLQIMHVRYPPSS